MTFIGRLLAGGLLVCSGSPASAAVDPKVRSVPLASEAKVSARGSHWVISTQGESTTRIAAEVLRGGGNLIDAAIAASISIGVERPHSTGLGGGGFLIYHEAKSGKNHVFDFRERAPAEATPRMFLGPDGDVIPGLSITGGKAVAVPGLVRGLKKIHERFGKRTWKELLEPSALLAEKGFKIYPALALALKEEEVHLKKDPDAAGIFFRKGRVLTEGETLLQKDLARSIRLLATRPESFYNGSIARALIATEKRTGGVMSLKDLNQYSVRERAAIEADWNGFHLVSMPPPSSGGIHVIQILKLVDLSSLKKGGSGSVRAAHETASAMQLAFADRAMYPGDPEFTKVPATGLISDGYLNKRRALILGDRALKRDEVGPGGGPLGPDHFETTHFSMMDAEGNAIVSTQTINGWFGAKIIARGTGIILNNEMDDFSAKVGASNLFGATAISNANEIRPGKTPLSSMSPTLVLKNGVPILALGAPGGTRIITAVAQTILNHLVFGKTLFDSVAAPRLHQQWSPDELMIENQEVPDDFLNGLLKLGWKIQRIPAQSHVMAVAREGDHLVGVSDPRDAGTSAAD